MIHAVAAAPTRPASSQAATRFDANDPFTNDAHPAGPAAPSLLHLCQSYRAGGQHYSKRGVSHDAFSCDAGVFKFDPAPIAALATQAAALEERVLHAILRYSRWQALTVSI